MKLIEWLERISRPGITAVALSLCVVVGVLDWMSGPDYSLAPFYLFPVVMAAWFAGRKAGYLLSLAGALSWLLAEMGGRKIYQFEFALLWNDLMEFLLLLLSALVVSSLKGALERENEMARTDQLTGISNRRHYLELVTAEMRRNLRYQEPFTVAYLDIDKFKTVNDTMGHAEGDKLLRQVANVIAAAIRVTDTVARIGGDEFALLLPNTAEESALTVAEKVQQQLKKEVESRWPITFSMGLVTYLKSPETIDEVIGRADRLMYEVKEKCKDDLRYEVVGNYLGSV